MKALKTLAFTLTLATLPSSCATKGSCKACPSNVPAPSCSTVPANILSAAQAKVPGFAMSSSDCDTEKGCKVYELDGKANGRKCEIKLDSTGQVLKVDRD